MVNTVVRRSVLPALLVLLMMLTGCETPSVIGEGFTPLDEADAARAVQRLKAATTDWSIVKGKLSCTFVVQSDGEERTDAIDGICVLQPDQALRVRFSKLGMNVADILYDRRFWFITDDMNGTVYFCRRIDRAALEGVPPVLLQQLQALPGGWLRDVTAGAEVSESDAAIKIHEQTRDFTRTLIFPKDRAWPSYVEMSTPDGNSFRASLTTPDTRFAATAATFAPNLKDYAVYDLDKRAWLKR
jgi:hypothetical protein